MSAASEWLRFGLLFVGVVGVAVPVGRHLLAVLDPEIAGGTVLEQILGPIERLTYRALGIDPKTEQSGGAYARSLLLSGGVVAGVLLLGALTWRGVALLPLAMAAWAGLVRHAARPHGATVGLFGRDVVRLALYLFLPALLVLAPFLFVPGLAAAFLQLATGGKDPFGVTSADLLRSLLLVGVAAGFADYLGRMVGERASRWVVLTVMSVILALEIQRARIGGATFAEVPLSGLWPLTPLPLALLGAIVRKRTTG